MPHQKGGHYMNAKELYGLFLRVVGVLGMVFIVRHALQNVPVWGSLYLLSKWVIGALVALYLMRGAPLLVKFSYPDKPGSPTE
jgi:hypothetical protein